jgi:hypothetical protein
MKTKRILIQICLLSAALLTALTSHAQPVVTKVAAGEYDTLFIKSDGSLWGMGKNAHGELGDGSTAPSYYPEQIVPSGVTAIAVGNYHSLFLKSDGSLWVMGYNDEGQLGDGTSGAGHDSHVPEKIMPSGVTAIAAGAYHSLFIESGGSLWGMGDNSFGQLGGGPSGFSVSPTEIVTSEVTAIAAAGNHELFVKRPTHTSVQLWVMGDNAYGQLGEGNNNNPVYPSVPVEIFSANNLSIPGVAAIATGTNHSLYVRNDGSLWAMGYNRDGELGDNTTDNNNYETNRAEEIVTGGVATVAAGDYHSVFMKNDGSLWVMGDNFYGELGDNNTTTDPSGLIIYGVNSTVPEEIIASGVTAVTGGGYDTLFIRSDGSLWGMGDSSYGKLGDGGMGSFIPEEIVWPPPPPLGITTYSNQPVVIFPTATGSTFLLQMTTNLASGVWGPAPSGVPFTAVQFTNVPPNAFFRLQPPQ